MLTVDALRGIVGRAVGVGVDLYPPVGDRALEFRSGRAAAHAALASIGIAGADVPDGDAGPVWPDGVVGSISHSAGTAVAIAGWSLDRLALGVDIERQDRALDERVVQRIASPVEREWLTASSGVEPLMLFCAKEATFKALARFVPHRVSFSDVEFRLPYDGSLAGRISPSASRYTPVAEVTARMVISGGFIVAVVGVDASAVNGRVRGPTAR